MTGMRISFAQNLDGNQAKSRRDCAKIKQKKPRVQHASSAHQARVQRTSSTHQANIKHTSNTRPANIKHKGARLTEITHESNAHRAKPHTKAALNPDLYNTHPPHAAKKAAMHTHRSPLKQPTKRRSISNNGSTPRSFPPRKPCTDPRDFRAYTPCGTTDIHSAA